MDRRALLAAVAGTGLVGGAGCLSSAADGADPAVRTPESGTPVDVDAPVGPFVDGNAAFGLALLDRMAGESPTTNRFCSPYSVGVALAMTYAGARGETRTEMAEALRFSPTGGELHDAVASLLGDLAAASDATNGRSDSGTEDDAGTPLTLRTANALWGQTDFPFADAFVDTLADHYGAGMGAVDFEADPEAARRAINDWVAERTEDHVEELFAKGTIDDATRLVLANAVYFAANWASTFDEDRTEDAPFTGLDGAERDAPTMAQQDRFEYASVDGVAVLSLPYVGGTADMVVLLPPRERFREFERSLTVERLRELTAALEQREVDVRLPKFSVRTRRDLPTDLEAMGMERAFGRDADFSGMTEGDAGKKLQVGAVVHEAFVDVDERGTEAAAATGVEVELTSAGPKPVEFVADHPFVFAIRHRESGALLFLGRYVTPSGA